MRLINRVLAALLALALIVVGVIVVVEVIADRINSQHTAIVNWHPAYRWATRNTWNVGSLRVAAAVLIVIGLVLLIAELKPPRVSRLTADSGEAGADGIDTAYTRRGVAAAVRSAVGDVDGVRRTSVKVKRRRVQVAVTAVFLDRAATSALRESITDAARQRLATLHLRHRSAVSVRVTSRSR